jgi:hypothetical protein
MLEQVLHLDDREWRRLRFDSTSAKSSISHLPTLRDCHGSLRSFGTRSFAVRYTYGLVVVLHQQAL